MEQITKRLKPGEDLRKEIEKLARARKIKAGCVLSIVGGLERAKLRMAGSEPEKQAIKEWQGPFEIVSGTGTISKDGCHIHISLSDKEGNVVGGHVKEGCTVKYTVEVVLLAFGDVVYKRRFDKETGFDELSVE